MQYKKNLALFAGVCLVVLSGCAVSQPGATASIDPPRLLKSISDNPNVWDYASSFGPVPATLQAEGDNLCKSTGMDHASGYHPHAEDVNGVPYPHGGFLCARKG